MDEGAGGLASSGWVSMASESEGGGCRGAGWDGRWGRVAGAVAPVSGALGAPREGGTRRAVRSL